MSDRCTLSPSYSVTVLQQGGEQAVIGAGTVYVEAGRHLLPSRLGQSSDRAQLTSDFH